MGNRYAAGEHEHSFLGSDHDANARRTRWVVALTFAMMVGEVIAGYVTGSMALLADGFHMATHAGALGIAAAAYAYAKHHAHDQAFSFGTGKVGELAGFASALVLGIVSLVIGVESVIRLVNPSSVAFGEAAVIAVIGLLVNIVSAMLLSGGHHHLHGHGHGHEHEHPDASREYGHRHAPTHGRDNNLRSAYMHVLADALTSVLAILALLAGRYLGWVWLDSAVGIAGAIVIARWAWILMRDTGGVLLDTSDERIAQAIRQALKPYRDMRITDLHVWQIGPEARAAIVSVAGGEGVSTADIRSRLASIGEIRHLTVEIAPP